MRLRSQFKKVHRTSFRSEKEDWVKFQKECEKLNKTACQVLRQLIKNFIKNPYRARELETGSLNIARPPERGGWTYNRETMTLYNTAKW